MKKLINIVHGWLTDDWRNGLIVVLTFIAATYIFLLDQAKSAFGGPTWLAFALSVVSVIPAVVGVYIVLAVITLVTYGLYKGTTAAAQLLWNFGSEQEQDDEDAGKEASNVHSIERTGS